VCDNSIYAREASFTYINSAQHLTWELRTIRRTVLCPERTEHRFATAASTRCVKTQLAVFASSARSAASASKRSKSSAPCSSRGGSSTAAGSGSRSKSPLPLFERARVRGLSHQTANASSVCRSDARLGKPFTRSGHALIVHLETEPPAFRRTRGLTLVEACKHRSQSRLLRWSNWRSLVGIRQDSWSSFRLPITFVRPTFANLPTYSLRDIFFERHRWNR
jgi:hypothetical protein